MRAGAKGGKGKEEVSSTCRKEEGEGQESG